MTEGWRFAMGVSVVGNPMVSADPFLDVKTLVVGKQGAWSRGRGHRRHLQMRQEVKGSFVGWVKSRQRESMLSCTPKLHDIPRSRTWLPKAGINSPSEGHCVFICRHRTMMGHFSQACCQVIPMWQNTVMPEQTLRSSLAFSFCCFLSFLLPSLPSYCPKIHMTDLEQGTPQCQI